jgi:hypothetical protein
MAAQVEVPNLTEGETREALEQLDRLWDSLFPAEQARIIRLPMEPVVVGPGGADIRLRVEGLASMASDLSAGTPNPLREAAWAALPASSSGCL